MKHIKLFKNHTNSYDLIFNSIDAVPLPYTKEFDIKNRQIITKKEFEYIKDIFDTMLQYKFVFSFKLIQHHESNHYIDGCLYLTKSYDVQPFAYIQIKIWKFQDDWFEININVESSPSVIMDRDGKWTNSHHSLVFKCDQIGGIEDVINDYIKPVVRKLPLDLKSINGNHTLLNLFK